MLSMKHSQNHEFKELAIQAKYFLLLHPSGSQNYSCFPSTTSLAQWIQKPLKSSFTFVHTLVLSCFSDIGSLKLAVMV